MKAPLIIKNEILINASVQAVWDALTNPAQTKKYMYGCEAISTWKQGDTLNWKGEYNGKEMIFVTGKIVRIEPETYLEYTTFDPNSSMENNAANHLTVSYQLQEENKQTKLTVTQGDYSKVAEGDRRYKETYNNGEGWNPILMEIKKLVETV